MCQCSRSKTMTDKFGYIYVRTHSEYDYFNACKLGRTMNIIERDTQYATGEIVRGKFTLVLEVRSSSVSMIETLLHEHFANEHVLRNGGTEFYSKSVINCIEPYLKKHKIVHRLLSEYDVNSLLRTNRLRNFIFRKVKHSQEHFNVLKPYPKTYIPRDYQIEIINNSVEHFKTNNKGMLVLTCGVGKTLMSLWIAKEIGVMSLLVGVPNLLLVSQWVKVVNKVLQNYKVLIIKSGTEHETIKDFLMGSESTKRVVIITYASAHKLKNVCSYLKFAFEMTINDECHHLTSFRLDPENYRRRHVDMLKIPSILQLSLTATLKNIEMTPTINNNNNIEEVPISNDNVEQFGSVIETRPCYGQ